MVEQVSAAKEPVLDKDERIRDRTPQRKLIMKTFDALALMVEKASGKRLKTLRTDNGGEYHMYPTNSRNTLNLKAFVMSSLCPKLQSTTELLRIEP